MWLFDSDHNCSTFCQVCTAKTSNLAVHRNSFHLRITFFSFAKQRKNGGGVTVLPTTNLLRKISKLFLLKKTYLVTLKLHSSQSKLARGKMIHFIEAWHAPWVLFAIATSFSICLLTMNWDNWQLFAQLAFCKWQKISENNYCRIVLDIIQSTRIMLQPTYYRYISIRIEVCAKYQYPKIK